jgi:hypothetical protein
MTLKTKNDGSHYWEVWSLLSMYEFQKINRNVITKIDLEALPEHLFLPG